ncbi:MAG TPA: bifunctional indole-3-glycerol-phosphate synthase TrpC/phosphoribosylanthranilate isomerase TrpF [Ktedonobacteraceae bacterium]|nr:bifunctional indole-3-glycerol-phosphate synthase TrpC/phosphoribosylanthranilate isomerase TrpF [Ktedonobacteraceae bacterium]
MFLDRIISQTRIDLEQRKLIAPFEEQQRLAYVQGTPRDLLQSLKVQSRIGLIAEVKRASPSKGKFVPDVDPVKLAQLYAAHGVAAISVLTEPHFFLGSSDYLTAIKRAVQVPVLCKDFIIDEYQVYEARAWGADAILLICAILDQIQLQRLLKVAHDLNMHCLVEVHTSKEVQRAISAGASIIGINSRDLKTFQIHPDLIRDLRPLIPKNTVVVAESGIHTGADARRLARYDVQAMLVGESLVTSQDIPAQIRTLLKGANENVQIKICGLRTTDQILTARDAGVDLLGLMFYEPSPRYIQPQAAREILKTYEDAQMSPDIVGIFVNKEAEYINDVVEQVGLHFVQLHGDESPEFCTCIHRPVIKALRLNEKTNPNLTEKYYHTSWRILLDTPTAKWGGTGETHDWDLARTIARQTPIFLAGGLTPENVGKAIQHVHPWGVDVSSGVEIHGKKDVKMIQAFVENARTSR